MFTIATIIIATIIAANKVPPFGKALSAAYTELTTPEAIQWYRATATQTWLVIATIAVACYQLVETYLLSPTEAETPLATPEPTPALAIHNIKAVVIPASNALRSTQAHIFYKR